MTVNLNWKGAMFFCVTVLLLGTFTMAYQWYSDEEGRHIETSLNIEELGLRESLMSQYPVITGIERDEGKTEIFVSDDNSRVGEIVALEEYIRGLETSQTLGNIQDNTDLPFCMKAQDGVLVSCKPVLEGGEQGQGYVMRCAPDPQCDKLIG